MEPVIVQLPTTTAAVKLGETKAPKRYGSPFRTFPLELFQKNKISYDERIKLYKQRISLRILDYGPITQELKNVYSGDPLLTGLIRLYADSEYDREYTLRINRFSEDIHKYPIVSIEQALTYLKDTGDNRKRIKTFFDKVKNEHSHSYPKGTFDKYEKLFMDIVSKIKIPEGYIWSYFGLLNVEDLRKRYNLREEIKNTELVPHTFEKYALPFELEDYAQYLRLFNEKKTQNAKAWQEWILPDIPPGLNYSQIHTFKLSRIVKWGINKNPTWEHDRIYSFLRYLKPTNEEVNFYDPIKPKGKFPVWFIPSYTLRHAYRHYYGTVRFLDWENICRRRLITLDTLRTIVKHDFHIKGIETMSQEKICSLVLPIVKEEISKYDQMLRDISHQSSKVLWQPGGLKNIGGITTKTWRNQLIKARKKNFEQGPPKPMNTKEQIMSICRTPTNANKLVLTDLIWSLGLRSYLPMGITQTTNQQLCQVLQRYYAITTERPFLPPETEALLEDVDSPSLMSPPTPISTVQLTPLSSVDSPGNDLFAVTKTPTGKQTITYPAATAPESSIKKIKT